MNLTVQNNPPNKLSETITINFSECDLNSEWRPSAILQIAQDISGRHSDLLGCGDHVIREQDMVWLLARQRYQFQRYPQRGDTVTVSTWPGKVRFTMYPRYLTFCAADGTPLGSGSTIWFLMRRSSSELLTPTTSSVGMPDTTAHGAPAFVPERIRLPEGDYQSTQRQVCYSDADFNHHLNNARYMEWICDLLDPGRFAANFLADFTLNYSREAKLGDQVCLRLLEQQEHFYVQGKNARNDEELFTATGCWQKK